MSNNNIPGYSYSLNTHDTSETEYNELFLDLVQLDTCTCNIRIKNITLK